MGDSELEFVDTMLRKKPNYWVYRTPDGRGLGDFLVVDKSIAAKFKPGWFIELKDLSSHKTTTSHAGRQLVPD